GPEEGVAQPLGLRLHHIADVRWAEAAAVILDDVGFACRDRHADAGGAGEDHPLDQVLRDRLRPLRPAGDAGADRKQLLGEGERLDAAPHAGGGHDPPDAHARAPTCSASTISAALLSAVCSASVRSRAARATLRISSWGRERTSKTSSVLPAVKISRPGSK